MGPNRVWCLVADSQGRPNETATPSTIEDAYEGVIGKIEDLIWAVEHIPELLDDAEQIEACIEAQEELEEAVDEAEDSTEIDPDDYLPNDCGVPPEVADEIEADDEGAKIEAVAPTASASSATTSNVDAYAIGIPDFPDAGDLRTIESEVRDRLGDAWDEAQSRFPELDPMAVLHDVLDTIAGWIVDPLPSPADILEEGQTEIGCTIDNFTFGTFSPSITIPSLDLGPDDIGMGASPTTATSRAPASKPAGRSQDHSAVSPSSASATVSGLTPDCDPNFQFDGTFEEEMLDRVTPIELVDCPLSPSNVLAYPIQFGGDWGLFEANASFYLGVDFAQPFCFYTAADADTGTVLSPSEVWDIASNREEEIQQMGEDLVGVARGAAERLDGFQEDHDLSIRELREDVETLIDAVEEVRSVADSVELSGYGIDRAAEDLATLESHVQELWHEIGEIDPAGDWRETALSEIEEDNSRIAEGLVELDAMIQQTLEDFVWQFIQDLEEMACLSISLDVTDRLADVLCAPICTSTPVPVAATVPRVVEELTDALVEMHDIVRDEWDSHKPAPVPGPVWAALLYILVALLIIGIIVAVVYGSPVAAAVSAGAVVKAAIIKGALIALRLIRNPRVLRSTGDEIMSILRQLLKGVGVATGAATIQT